MINFIGGLIAGLILSLMALVLLTEHRNEEDREKTEHMIKLINERDYWQKQYLFERGKKNERNSNYRSLDR